ncbi:hypothetical protein C8R44DRAFT_992480 [Mycena epipterygia]|nr:hypothetical protein C8R44DRAFT_992480 [Mycena epipterygia]
MSQGRLSLGIFPPAALAEAIALGNPSDPFRSRWWSPLQPQKFSSFVVWDTSSGADGALPDSGETSFVVDAEYQVFGSGAAITICYERNVNVLECAENTALDGTNRGIGSPTIELILDRVQTKPGLRTHVEFRTLPGGSLHIEARLGPMYPDAQVLSNSVPLPSVPLSSLRCTHQLAHNPNIFLVKTVLDPLSDDVRVFKTSNGQSSLVEEVEFMACLPDVDFLLRPTHTVLDEAGVLHGLLSHHHPASAVLPPFGVDRSSYSLAGTTTSVSWTVKLAWATDIAASVAWLHAQAIFWGDLKTDNIVLCTDGHCISKTESVWLIWGQTYQTSHRARIMSGSIITFTGPELIVAPTLINT